MLIAAIRPDSVNFPLFLHVLGAMLLVGTLIGVALATVLGWRSQDNAQGLARFSLKMLLLGVLPARKHIEVVHRIRTLAQSRCDGMESEQAARGEH